MAFAAAKVLIEAESVHKTSEKPEPVVINAGSFELTQHNWPSLRAVETKKLRRTRQRCKSLPSSRQRCRSDKRHEDVEYVYKVEEEVNEVSASDDEGITSVEEYFAAYNKFLAKEARNAQLRQHVRRLAPRTDPSEHFESEDRAAYNKFQARESRDKKLRGNAPRPALLDDSPGQSGSNAASRSSSPTRTDMGATPTNISNAAKTRRCSFASSAESASFKEWLCSQPPRWRIGAAAGTGWEFPQSRQEKHELLVLTLTSGEV